MKIGDKALRRLIEEYDSEIDFNDRVSSEKFLEFAIEAFRLGYCTGYIDSNHQLNPKYILMKEYGKLVTTNGSKI